MALSKAPSLASGEPEPICIIDFDDPRVDGLVALEGLLATVNPHCKIVSISIVGRRRAGKSFLLSFFIRYLRARCGTQKKTDDWMDHDADEELVGFRWAHTTKSVTRGILIWPELFKISDEVAVMLMDTQGIFDDEATLQTDAHIFSLSLLLSSMQIFNIKGDIDRDYLDNLDMFMKIARLASGDPSTPTEAPTRLSQKLIFLLRDWQNSHEFDYGWTGGRDRLNACRSGASASTLATVSESFHDELECFLMPRPGDGIVEKTSHKLSDIKPIFKLHVKEFVEYLFRPENLERIGSVGKEITSASFARMTKRFIGEVGSDRYPILRDVVSRVAAENITTVVNRCMDDFHAAMTLFVADGPYEPDAFEQHVKRKVDEILECFKSAKKIEVRNIVEPALQKLTAEMDSFNRMFLKINTHTNATVAALVRSYEAAMSGLVARSSFQPEEFEKHLDSKFDEILEQYNTLRTLQFGRISERANRELEAKINPLKEKFRKTNEKAFCEQRNSHFPTIPPAVQEKFASIRKLLPQPSKWLSMSNNDDDYDYDDDDIVNNDTK